MVSFRRLLALAGLAGIAHVVPAVAAEWTLSADVSQRFEADSNFGLERDSSGTAYGAINVVDLNLRGRTKRTQWNLNSGAQFSVFSGGGSGTQLDRADPKIDGGIRHQGKRFNARAAFRFTRSPVDFTQVAPVLPPAGSVILPGGFVVLPDDTIASLDDFVTITDDNAIQNRLNVRGGFTFDIDPLNQLSLSATSTIVRFTGETAEAEDANSFGTTMRWDHDLTESTSTLLTLGLQRFTVDNDENSRSLTLTTKGGIDTELTPRLTFGVDAGLSASKTKEDSSGSDTTHLGAEGGLRLGWHLSDTEITFAANQSVEPSTVGELQNRSTLELLIEHSINNTNHLSLAASFSRQIAVDATGNAERRFFAVTPAYSVNLSPYWQAQMGYSFRLRDDQVGLVTSNKIFLTISRSFNLLQ